MYPCIIRKDGKAWFAVFRDLGCAVCADSYEEVIERAREGLRYWLSFGDSPAPSTALETAATLEEGDTLEMISPPHRL